MKKAILSLFALFLAACTTATPASSTVESTPPPFTETPTAISDIPTEIHTSTPGPTPPAIDSPTDTPLVAPALIIPTLETGATIQLSSLYMIDAQTGWGIHVAADLRRPDFHTDPFLGRPEGYIVRTTDGGTTWKNVTPPTGAYSAQGFFALDANTAWASENTPCCMSQDMTQIWYTTDGGQTWQASQPFSIKIPAEFSAEFYLPLQLVFIDPNTGWLLSSSRAGRANTLRAMLFHTSDGGQTWTDMQIGVNGFIGNCSNGGLVFIDSTTGWYGTSCVGSPRVFQFNEMFGEGGWRLQKTTDAGHSFTPSTMIPTPPELQALAATNPEMDCGERRVALFASNVLGIEWECRSYETYQDYHYFSLSPDTGGTWKTWETSGNEYFIDAAHGWRLLSPGQLQQTIDGGSNWSTIKTVAWENAQFEFINAQEGWAIVSSGNVNALVHTTDGGQAWLELKPIVTP